MKYIIKFILSGVMIIMLMACEKTMFIDLPDEEHKIVMNGLLTPDYGLWLNVSRSVSSSEPSATSFKPVTGAIIRYYQNDNFITSLINSNERGDYFETDFRPQPGHTYKITVDTYGMPQAGVVVTIPYPVNIIGFDTTIVKNRQWDGYRYYNEVEFFVNLRIRDPEITSNHYMLGLYYLENNNYQPLEAYTEDINMNIHIQDGLNILAWNDRNLNGQLMEFMVNFQLVQDAGFETEFVITLYSIEEDYFKYLKSYSQNFTILNDDTLLFEPVLVSSNIINGYGIVAAFSSHSVSFRYTFY